MVTAHQVIVDWMKWKLSMTSTFQAPSHAIVDNIRDYSERWHGKMMSAGTVERRWREFKADDTLRRRAGVGSIIEQKGGSESVWIIQRGD